MAFGKIRPVSEAAEERMRYLLLILTLTMSLLAAPLGKAHAKSFNISESFTLSVEPRQDAKRVLVRFNHPQFGWVDAGYVDFCDDGKILLKIRGEDTEVISDLGGKLSRFSEKKVGDPAIGLELAMNIEGAVEGL